MASSLELTCKSTQVEALTIVNNKRALQVGYLSMETGRQKDIHVLQCTHGLLLNYILYLLDLNFLESEQLVRIILSPLQATRFRKAFPM